MPVTELSAPVFITNPLIVLLLVAAVIAPVAANVVTPLTAPVSVSPPLLLSTPPDIIAPPLLTIRPPPAVIVSAAAVCKLPKIFTSVSLSPILIVEASPPILSVATPTFNRLKLLCVVVMS